MATKPFNRCPSSPPARAQTRTPPDLRRRGKRGLPQSLLVVVAGIGVSILVVGLGLSTGFAQSETAAAQDSRDDAAAERAQLTARLQMLQRSKDGLGASHPSLAGIQTQIAEVRKQLRALGPVSPRPSSPTSPRSEGTARAAVPAAAAATSDPDLRQVVLTMAEEIGRLTRRVNLLEDEVTELKGQVARR